MFKEYKFHVKVISKGDDVYLEKEMSWKDKGEGIAKDMLRISLQEDFKRYYKHYPKNVELKCLTPDVGCYEEDK